MAQPVRFSSAVHTQEEDADISFLCYQAVKEAKTNAKENLQMAASICDSMNNLCTSMNRLDNLMERIIFCNGKENSR